MSIQATHSEKIEETINFVLGRPNKNVVEISPKKVVTKIKSSIKKVKKTTTHKREKLSFIRGKRVFELCQKYPLLEKEASSRKPELNQKRNKIWEEVVAQLNEEFKDTPGYQLIDVIQARKLEDYYKKRCKPDSPLSPEILALFKEFTVAPPFEGALIDREKPLDENELCRERLSYMTVLAKRIMDATKLAHLNQGRSAETNERRMMMWKFITITVNNRYGPHIGNLQEAQAKKSYSNYKRRHPEFLLTAPDGENSAGQYFEDDDEGMTEETETVESVMITDKEEYDNSSPKLENFDMSQMPLIPEFYSVKPLCFGITLNKCNNVYC